MPKLNLSKQFGQSLKSQLDIASGSLSNIGEAGGKGAFSIGAGENGLSINANFNSLVQNKVTQTEPNGPLKKLYQNTTGEKALRFPMDLDDENYMIISVLERDRVASNNRNPKTMGTNRKAKEHYVLPLPSNLVAGHSLNYQNQALGIAGSVAAGNLGKAEAKEVMDAAMNTAGQMYESVKNTIATGETDATVDTVKDVGTGIAIAGLATSIAASAGGVVAGILAAGAVGDGLAAGASSRFGVAVNPHLAVIFEGQNFREHTFQYKFIARSQGESERLYQIIRGLEYHMLPSYTAGRLGFNYPNEFKIDFSEKHKNYLYNIGECVLKSMSVNYNGEGIPVFFESSGAPVSVDITMTFQETKIITRETIERTY